MSMHPLKFAADISYRPFSYTFWRLKILRVCLWMRFTGFQEVPSPFSHRKIVPLTKPVKRVISLAWLIARVLQFWLNFVRHLFVAFIYSSSNYYTFGWIGIRWVVDSPSLFRSPPRSSLDPSLSLWKCELESAIDLTSSLPLFLRSFYQASPQILGGSY